MRADGGSFTLVQVGRICFGLQGENRCPRELKDSPGLEEIHLKPILVRAGGGVERGVGREGVMGRSAKDGQCRPSAGGPIHPEVALSRLLTPLSGNCEDGKKIPGG